MAKTSTAEKYNYICPRCGDEFNQDRKGRGFVAHRNNPDCNFERGLKNKIASNVGTNGTYGGKKPRHKVHLNSWAWRIDRAIKRTKLYGKGALSLLKRMSRSARKSYRALRRLNKELEKINQKSGLFG